MRTWLSVCVLVVQLLWSSVGNAVRLPDVGTIVAERLELVGKHVSLPTGKWRVTSVGFGHVAEDSGPGPYGAIAAVLLVQTGDEHDRPFLLIQTNVLPVRDGWGQPAECASPDVLLSDIAETRNLHNACSFIIATRPSRLARAALPALSDESLKDALPSWALVLGFRVSDRRDVLDIRYGIIPREPTPGGWFIARDMMDEAHQAAIGRLGTWLLKARQGGFAALRVPASQIHPLPPLPFGEVAAQDVPTQEISAVRLGIYKLGTYRVASTLSSLVMGTIVTGNLYDGAILSFWQSLTHSAVYLGNELVWEWPQATPEEAFIATLIRAMPRELPPLGSDEPRALVAANIKNVSWPLAVRDPIVPTGVDAGYVRGVFGVDGKQVPLPDGTWTILASKSDNRTTGIVLGRLDGRVLTGLVMIRANPMPMTAIFGTSGQCRRRDIAFAVTRYDTPEDGYCTYGKRVMPDSSADPTSLWGEVLARLSQDGIRPPPEYMMVGARARTRENYLDIRYYFLPSPELMHRDIEDMGLTPDPIEALQTWADLAQDPIELGVRGRLPASASPLPWPWQTNTVKDTLVWQARGPLEDLAAMGVLDHGHLRHQLAVADRALADREEQRWSLWERSAYKVATYRAASFVDTTAVTALVTGSTSLGLGYASVTAVFKPIVAYANEIFWAQAAVGKAPASLLPANFPEIGKDVVR